MRAWVTDLVVAAVACAGAAARVAAAPVLPGDRAPDLAAYTMVVGMAVVLLARRRWPASVLAAVVVLFLGYHVYGYPGGAPAVPVWIALYSVAVAPRGQAGPAVAGALNAVAVAPRRRSGSAVAGVLNAVGSRRRAGFVVAGVLIVIDAQSRMLVAGIGPLDAALDGSTGMFVASLLLGEAVRARRERLLLLAADRDRAAEQRLVAERLRIARELHDLSAHTLAVVSVQAGVAEDVLDDDPAQARRAISAVRLSAREAMTELRAAVGVLRNGTRPDPFDPPAPTLDRLTELAAATGATLVEEGERRKLPRAVEATAYRIVQEAVANAVRHSGASAIEIRIGYAESGLSLAVSDDGTGAGGPPGNGLRGMAERATGLGGRLRAGPRADGGYEVRGWLPA